VTRYRSTKVHNAAGEVVRIDRVEIPEHRVTFSKVTWLNQARWMNVRTIYFDGREIGQIYGIEPSPYNANRPTAFEIIRPGEEPSLQDRLESARGWLESELTTGERAK
jgi:hypothetical protein